MPEPVLHDLAHQPPVGPGLAGDLAGAVDAALSKRAAPDDDTKLIKRETLELVRAFYKIRQLRVRTNIVETIKSLGKLLKE